MCVCVCVCVCVFVLLPMNLQDINISSTNNRSFRVSLQCLCVYVCVERGGNGAEGVSGYAFSLSHPLYFCVCVCVYVCVCNTQHSFILWVGFLEGNGNERT